MSDRSSPLASRLSDGAADGALRLSTRTNLSLWQVAAWPDTAATVSKALSDAVGADAPPFGRVASGPDGALLRLNPLKWWIIDGARPRFDAEQAVTLDLSHEQTPISITGPDAAALLARLVSIDLRDAAFPVGAFAATGGRHMMLKLWRTGPEAYELFVMRSFAAYCGSLLDEHGAQFGAAWAPASA